MMNKYMHPRNPYRNPPNFKKLALDYPEFRKYANQDLSGKITLDFKSKGAVWSLTKALLHRDFKLDVEIVEGRLVPTLPLRMNYLLWLEDLMKLYKNKDDKIHGIDIGAGACCIYPLLACKHFSWFMTATEVDEENDECALKNVKRNNLENFITVKRVNEQTFLDGVLEENVKYDFCMCNPPFFDDEEERRRRHDDDSEPRNAPTGAHVELVTHGGEVSFVRSIIDDSIKLVDRIRIYTVMLGRKASISPIKEYARNKNIPNMAVTMFCQGKTTRWGFAWSYDSTLDLKKVSHEVNKKPVNVYTQTIPKTSSFTFTEADDKLLDLLKKLEIIIENELNEDGVHVILLKALNKTWINSRKKRREENRKLSEGNNNSSNNGNSEEVNFDKCGNSNIIQGNTLKRSHETKDNDEVKNKKIKLSDEDYTLVANLSLNDSEHELELSVTYLKGTGGKDGAHQLLTYLKNVLK